MSTVNQDQPRGGGNEPLATKRRPERTCVACREKGSPHGLLRLVVGPDGQVLLDPAGRAAGRGAWLHPRPECFGRAARGLARSLKRPVKTSPGELWVMARTAADRRVGGLISAAWRARQLEVGSTLVNEAWTERRSVLIVVASDARAAAETPGVLEAIAAGRARAWGDKVTLGQLCGGKDEVGVVAVLDEGLAQALCFAMEVAQMPPPPEETRKDRGGQR